MEKKILGSRYELLEQIEQGGMSTVYKAKDNVLNRIVAVKVLKKEFLDNSDFLVKFNNEARAAASINHQNIINVYDVGKDADAAFIVMEYVDGINLKQLIKNKGTLSEAEAITILKQICYALREAHNHGIIHRDVKPHNIMIGKDNVVKIGDFGIAKATSSATITSVGEVLGSVHYFSPEQARNSYMDSRSDIYSLGIVLYEMLIGKTPFDGDTPVNVALKHINDTVRIPQEYKRKLSRPIQSMILKMTNKDMDMRYDSVDELIKDIDTINEGKEDIDFKIGEDNFETKIIKMPHGLNRQREVKNTNRKKRKLNVKNILAVSVLLLSVIVLLFNAESIYDAYFNKKTVVIPDLIDMKEDEAKGVLEDMGLKLKVTDEKDSDKEKGIIIYQNPVKGVKIRKGEEISVMVSNGINQVLSVPNLVGKTVNEAKAKLEESGFEVEVEYEYSEEIAKDTVISQGNAAGEELKKGSSISLTVSKGSDETKSPIPNFIGLTLDQAKERLGDFELGNVSYKQDLTKADGIILVQNPPKDELAKKGGNIDVIINKIEENVSSGNGSSQQTDTQKLYVTKNITLVLPQKESLKLTLIDKATGITAYNTNISTMTSPNCDVPLSAGSGESKQYDVYIDDVYYSSTAVIAF